MTPHEQTDMFGGSVPLDELELTGHLRALAEAEREQGGRLSADEAGALIHSRREKHPVDERCNWCSSDGMEALSRLRARQPHEEPLGPPWRCEDCGHENPAGARLCRRCASGLDDDREPVVTRLAPSPSSDQEGPTR